MRIDADASRPGVPSRLTVQTISRSTVNDQPSTEMQLAESGPRPGSRLPWGMGRRVPEGLHEVDFERQPPPRLIIPLTLVSHDPPFHHKVEGSRTSVAHLSIEASRFLRREHPIEHQTAGNAPIALPGCLLPDDGGTTGPRDGTGRRLRIARPAHLSFL